MYFITIAADEWNERDLRESLAPFCGIIGFWNDDDCTVQLGFPTCSIAEAWLLESGEQLVFTEV